MANELREYLEGLNLKDEAIDKAVELATPDSFRSDLAELGGKVKDYETELADLRPLKDADKRKEALKRVGVDYDSQPRSVRKTFDAIPSDKLDDLEHVAGIVKEEGIEAQIEEPEARERNDAEVITDFTSDMGSGKPVKGKVTPEDYGKWSPEKRREFQKKHPEATETLKRGEPAAV